MKKVYNAPSLEFSAFCSNTAISNKWEDTFEGEAVNSQPWNDGELGWT